MDVVYDHFLATDTNEFTEDSLLDFSQTVYAVLEDRQTLLPAYFAGMFPYMRSQNWLYNYRTKWGTEKSLGGVVRRALYLEESQTAFHLFEEHYQLLKDCYRQFWAEAKPFARNEFDQLIK
ncbi:MAG TPA: acyl carrier protein phosphodiesterase [Chitinophagaceae bacterium]